MKSALSAYELRRWAAECETQARDPGTDREERGHLAQMQEALLTLAVNQEWLDASRPLEVPRVIRSVSFHL